MPKTVADAMSRDPIVVRPETPLNEAIKLLQSDALAVFPL